MKIPVEDLIGKQFRDIWPEEFHPLVDAVMAKVLAGSQDTFDAYRLLGTEKCWWTVTIAPIFDSTGAVAKFISIGTDITYRKLAEEERISFYEQRLATEKLHAREKEQLLMELHDGIGGIASNISILAEIGQQAKDTESVKKTLATISQLSREEIAEIRGFMHSLDSKELNWRTLITELKIQGARMLEPHRIALQLDADVSPIDEQPGSLLWVNVFRIYKEAITNIIKHAHADTVVAKLAVRRNGMQLMIQDNGVGGAGQNDSGRGLANMRKRAEEIGGTLALDDRDGTLIRLDIPFPLR